jgi:ABC-type amino acid transport substrate-binding protein
MLIFGDLPMRVGFGKMILTLRVDMELQQYYQQNEVPGALGIAWAVLTGAVRRLVSPAAICANSAHLRWILAITGSIAIVTVLYAQEAPPLPVAIPDPIGGESTGDLAEIRKRGVLRALVNPSRTDFLVIAGRPLGLQTELLNQYVKSLNRHLKRGQRKIDIVYVPTRFDRLLPSLEEGKGDIAADLLTVTPGRTQRVAFVTGGLLKLDEVLVLGKEVEGPDTLEDLSGRTVYVLRGSSYVEHLQELNARLQSEGIAI